MLSLNRELQTLAPLLVSIALFATGCVTTTIRDSDSAYVYVAANGTITYRGEIFSSPEEVAGKLLSDGATPSTLITLIPQGPIPTVHLKGISNDFGRKGLSHVVIRERRKVSASVQQRGVGIEAQAPASVPKLKHPSRKGGRSSYGTKGKGSQTTRFRIVEP